MARPKAAKTVSLILGSGGARGLVHIGIIKELEAAGFKICSISGASMGALVGGAFATGKLDEFEEWVRAIKGINILNLVDVNWGLGGLLKGDKIRESVTQIFGDWKIEDLPIKFTAVAVDIVTEKEIWLSSGSLSDAVRASISMPLFMTPVRHGKLILVDGGVLNPVPIGPTLSDMNDITIAVNLGGLPTKTKASENQIARNKKPDAMIVGKIKSFIKELSRSHIARDTDPTPIPDMLNITDKTFDLMQNNIARQKLAANPPDYIIEIPRDTCGTLDFNQSADLIELGHQRGKELVKKIYQSK